MKNKIQKEKKKKNLKRKKNKKYSTICIYTKKIF